MNEIASAVSPTLGINPWGMLGCALTYAAAMFAAVDGIADHLLRRAESVDRKAVHALRLKMGAKLAAAAIAVLTAAIVLILDSNWIAFGTLSVLFVVILLWVSYIYRRSTGTAGKPTSLG